MSVFKKIKDVLFDIEEEDEEIVVKKEKKVIEDSPIKEVKMPSNDSYVNNEVVSEPVKSEPSFNFPLDFDDDIPVRRETPKVETYSQKNDKRDIFGDDFDMPRRNREDYIVKEPERKKEEIRDYSKFLQPKKDEKRIFTPSPVISPVYGVLNQNYTKDDVIVKTETEKSPSLDEVRKKAYTKKKEVKPEVDEFEEPLKTLDEILISNSKINEDTSLENDLLTDLEYKNEEIVDNNLEDNVSNDTEYEDDLLEKDLFNLIDSMYEDKEEEE